MAKLQPPLTAIDLLATQGQPVAHMFGLPLQSREAFAYMNFSAGTATPEEVEIIRSWVIAMTLVHGSWVAERLGVVFPDDASPT